MPISNSNSTHSNEQYPPEDRDILLGSLFLYKKVLIAKQFNKIGIPLSWQPTKTIMRRAIESEIDRGRLDLEKIHEVLVELEGWGRQQIYLYRFIGGTTLRNQWLDYDWLRESYKTSYVKWICQKWADVQNGSWDTTIMESQPNDKYRHRDIVYHPLC